MQNLQNLQSLRGLSFYSKTISGLLTGLVSYYKFSDGSGIIVSDAKGTYNGTWSGAGAHWTTGQIGGGGSFNGTDDYIGLPQALSVQAQNAFTISAWVKITNFTNYRAILYTNASNAGYYFQTLITADGGAGFMRLGAGGNSIDSLSAISANTWTHIVGSFNGSVFKIYFNGTLNNSGTITSTISDSLVTKNLGSYDHASEMFLGSMDEVGLWSRALTQSEVTQLYAGGVGLQYPF